MTYNEYYKLIALFVLIELKQQFDDIIMESKREREESNKKIQLLELAFYRSQYTNTITVAHEIGKKFLETASIVNQTPISFDNPDLSTLPQSCTNESEVQRKFVQFFKSLPRDQIQWSIVDTSSSNWLKDPIGKVDFSIIDVSEVVWLHFVSGIEIKYSLADTTSYHEAIGQLVDRFKTVFELQPE